MEKFSGWIASLSDGRTIFENQDSELGNWQTLLSHLRSNGIKMTALRLQIAGTNVISIKDADGYLQCTEYTKNMATGKEFYRRGLGSVIKDTVLMTWVDENRNVWQDIRNLDELKLHSTLA